jgi:uncharacterized membrane protein (UPF0127 family)
MGLMDRSAVSHSTCSNRFAELRGWRCEVEKMATISTAPQSLQDGLLLKVCVDGIEIADRVHVCVSSNARRQGLLGKSELGRREGVLLVMPERRRRRSGLVTSIHTIGMRFTITVTWLADDGEIVHVVLARPWRPYFGSPHPASYVLEVHPELLSRFEIGSILTWQPNENSKLIGKDK